MEAKPGRPVEEPRGPGEPCEGASGCAEGSRRNGGPKASELDGAANINAARTLPPSLFRITIALSKAAVTESRSIPSPHAPRRPPERVDLREAAPPEVKEACWQPAKSRQSCSPDEMRTSCFAIAVSSVA